MKKTFLLLFSIGHLFAATYYVDFAEGDNTEDGLSPQAAWKHCPGDANATDLPRALLLQPGDAIVFKGGVAYYGEIRLRASGEEGKPITLDGNTAGRFGEGSALLEGAVALKDWQPVPSQEEVAGHPRWRDILYCDIPLDLASNFNTGRFVSHRDAGAALQAPWQRVFLIKTGEGLLPLAQFPKAADPFYPEIPDDFLQSPHPLRDSPPPPEKPLFSLLVDDVNPFPEGLANLEGVFAGVHGGNNHVYFGRVLEQQPDQHLLRLPHFAFSRYDVTRYALYNSPRFLTRPGEWCLRDLGDGRTRIYLLTDPAEKRPPVGIGYPHLKTPILLDGVSHVDIKGFRIQRYAGGQGGVVTQSRGSSRPSHIRISDCDIEFLSGNAGISINRADHVSVERNRIRHCPGWTVGLYINRSMHFRVAHNLFDKNSGSGIRHYESSNGVVQDNRILNHYGMHASSVNFYVGCADIVFERNVLHNTLAINRNAENILIRNNLIDSQGKAPVSVALWTSGKIGGTAIHNVRFQNNSFLNTNREINWASAIYGQSRAGVSSPTGLVIENNILDGLRGDLPGQIRNNIFLREVEPRLRGENGVVVTDLTELFVDPAKGDYRLRPGSPAIGAEDFAPPVSP